MVHWSSNPDGAFHHVSTTHTPSRWATQDLGIVREQQHGVTVVRSGQPAAKANGRRGTNTRRAGRARTVTVPSRSGRANITRGTASLSTSSTTHDIHRSAAQQGATLCLQ